MNTTKFNCMEKIIQNRLPEAKKIEILFCSKQKKEKRYQVTVKIDGKLDIQTITNLELKDISQ